MGKLLVKAFNYGFVSDVEVVKVFDDGILVSELGNLHLVSYERLAGNDGYCSMGKLINELPQDAKERIEELDKIRTEIGKQISAIYGEYTMTDAEKIKDYIERKKAEQDGETERNNG